MLDVVCQRAGVQILRRSVFSLSFGCFRSNVCHLTALDVSIHNRLLSQLRILSRVVWAFDRACIILQGALLPCLSEVSLGNRRCSSWSSSDLFLVHYRRLFLLFQLLSFQFLTFRLAYRIEFHLILLYVSKVVVQWLLSLIQRFFPFVGGGGWVANTPFAALDRCIFIGLLLRDNQINDAFILDVEDEVFRILIHRLVCWPQVLSLDHSWLHRLCRWCCDLMIADIPILSWVNCYLIRVLHHLWLSLLCKGQIIGVAPSDLLGRYAVCFQRAIIINLCLKNPILLYFDDFILMCWIDSNSILFARCFDRMFIDAGVCSHQILCKTQALWLAKNLDLFVLVIAHLVGDILNVDHLINRHVLVRLPELLLWELAVDLPLWHNYLWMWIRWVGDARHWHIQRSIVAHLDAHVVLALGELVEVDVLEVIIDLSDLG